MGLSEREQQLLDEMERRLYQSEADVMQTSSGAPAQFNLRSLVLGIVVFLIGIGVLVGGVAAQQLWLGVVGFGVMLGGTLLAFAKRGSAASEGQGPARPTPGAGPQPAAAARESLSDRMQRRWDERMEGER